MLMCQALFSRVLCVLTQSSQQLCEVDIVMLFMLQMLPYSGIEVK